MKRNFKFNVKYSIFANESEYPKSELFIASSDVQAESKCTKMLLSFLDSSCTFKIHSVEKVSNHWYR